MKLKKRLGCICLVLLIASVSAGAQLVNPGFEKTYTAEEKTGYLESMKDGGWQFDQPLVFPEGWRVNISLTRGGEYRLVKDAGKAHSGENCVYVKGHLMHEQAIDVTAGDELGISFHVKDPAGKPAGACLYFYYRDEKGRNRFTGSTQSNVITKAGWSRQATLFKIPEESRGQRVNAVIVVLISNTGAYFDDVVLNHGRTAEWLNFQDACIEGNKKLVQGDFKGGREDFLAALDMARNNEERIEARLKIGETYSGEKEHLMAAEAFKEILLKERPGGELNVDIHFKVAGAYGAAKDYARVRDTLESLLGMEEIPAGVKVDARLKLADTYVKEKNYPGALAAFESLAEIKEAGPLEGVLVQFKIGDTHFAAGDKGRAREAYARVLSMPATTFIDRFEAHKRSGNTYRAEKDYANARKAYENALGVGFVNPYSEAGLLAVIAGTYVEEAKYGEARETYRRILDMGPAVWRNKKIAYARIGETYRKEGIYSKERETYALMAGWAEREITHSVSVEIPTAFADFFRLTGDSYWAEGKEEKAKEYYLLFLESGRARISDTHIRQVELKTGKNAPADSIRKARSLAFERKYGEAKAEYEKALSSREASARQKAAACMGMGNIFLAEADFDRARAEYGKVSGITDAGNEQKAEANMLTGDSYSIQQDYGQARGAYGKVLEMREAPPLKKIEAQEKISEMYRAEHNYSLAKEEYGKILKMEGLTDLKKNAIEQRIFTIYR